MAEQKIGQLLDTLGVTADLDDEDMPVDAVVLLKVVRADGAVSLVKGDSESLDWISSLGMLTAAMEIDRGGFTKLTEEPDE
ncbi:hypothetical protein ACIP69_18490 [Streptomyces hygroscopicus]|uniref:hypothetical protein n=1 Tax=Streptomyces hygroscopicus TaxID=1912 RepID=UPI0037F7BD77